MKKSIVIAFSGIFTALSVVLLYFGGIVWIFSYIVPLLSSFIVMIAKKSFNLRTSLIIYISVSIISIFILPDKECALLYVMFFGYYPIIKDNIEKFKSKILSIIFKFVLFNFSIVLAEIVCIYLFNIPYDNEFGKWGTVILLLSGNIVFLLYEKLFYMVEILYEKRIKKYLNKYLK